MRTDPGAPFRYLNDGRGGGGGATEASDSNVTESFFIEKQNTVREHIMSLHVAFPCKFFCSEQRRKSKLCRICF